MKATREEIARIAKMLELDVTVTEPGDGHAYYDLALAGRTVTYADGAKNALRCLEAIWKYVYELKLLEQHGLAKVVILPVDNC